MNDPLAFLDGGGEASRLIRERDWTGHPIGHPSTWSAELRSALSLILNSPESMILAWGPSLHFFFNEAYFPLLGPRLSWAMGERFDRVWADGWEQAKPIIDEAVAGRSRRFVDLPWKLDTDRGEQDTWWTFSYSRVLDAAGKVAGLFIFTNETTRRVKMNAALRESEEQLRLVIEGAVDHTIITTDPAGTITSWSAGAVEILGWTAEEARGQPLAMIFTPEDRLAGAEERERATAAGHGVAFDKRWHRRKDGGKAFLNGSLRPLPPDQAGAPRGFIKVAHDETARHAADQSLATTRVELAESEAFLRRVLESSTDCIKVLDLDGHLEFMSAGGMKVMEIDDFELFRRSYWPDLWKGPCEPLARNAVATAREGAVGRFTGYAPTAKGNLRYWDVVVTPILSRAGRPENLLAISRDISEQRRAEELLLETEERYRLAGKATNDAIWDWHLATDRVLWNDALHEAYGHGPATVEPIGGWWLDHIHPDDRERVSDSIHEAIDGASERWSAEYRFRRANGTYASVFDRGHVIRDETGRATRMIGAMLDLTERSRVEKALRDSEERYRTLFESIDEGFCVIEFFDGPHGPLSDYVHVEANPAYARHAGIDNVVGQTLREMVGEEADEWVRRYGEVLRTGKAIRFEQELVKTGRYLELSSFRVEPPERRQVAVLFQDITARKRAEAKLRESEALARENVQRVHLALEAGAIIGTWGWDLQADRFTIDEALARSFGLEPAKGLTGLSLSELTQSVHPDDRPGLDAAIRDAVRRGGAYAHQYRVRRADGRYYWVEANGRVDHAPDGTPLSFPGVLMDVDARRAVEAERDRALAQLRTLNDNLEQRVADRTADLMRAEEQLRQSQKMEAVGQLTGGIAHDFNNLLAGITGSLELMQTRISQGRVVEVDRYVLAAQGAAKRAAALTHRLLAFSRRQTLDPKPINVNTLIAGMEELVRRTVGPSIEVEVVGASGLWTTLVDPSQLENALLNLCINARDAMPDGGRITVETANKWLDRPAARRHDVPEGQYLSLCVTDTGTGMSPDVIEKAFDPFFTTKPIGQGTGLGLSMIYGFAKQSGGQVRIYSEVGDGTTVCIYLPRYHGAAEPTDPFAHVTVPETPTKGQSVLVVDDEPTIRMLVADLLEELGHTAIEAGDSTEGLRILQSGVTVDLLVTDVGLPGGMNGRQMADAGRVGRPNLKVLFITGYAENAAIGNGHLEPGMQVLTKPFPVDVLASRIAEMLEG